MFDGVVGSIIGALVGGIVSLGVALLVLNRTRRDNVDLAREQASLAAAQDLGIATWRIATELKDLRSMTDNDARALLRATAERFEVDLIAHAPAIRDEALRNAVEDITAVLRNFQYFAFESGAADGWVGLRITADVQRADYVYIVGEALTAYRRGDPFSIPLKPGWSLRKAQWRWQVPPGQHVDRSGTPRPEWKQEHDDEGSFWIMRSSRT